MIFINILMIFGVKEKSIILTHTMYCYKYTCANYDWFVCVFSRVTYLKKLFIPVITPLLLIIDHCITPVFSVTWSFRNHSNMLIWSLRNISDYCLYDHCLSILYILAKKKKKKKKGLLTPNFVQ